MTLEIGDIYIHHIRFGQKTRIEQQHFILEKEDFLRFLRKKNSRITTVDVQVVMPGDSVRIICVKDVIEPRCRVRGDEPGRGRIHRLQGLALVTCGKIVGYQEGLIDMSGPGAAYTPFSKCCNVIVEVGVANGISGHEHEEVVRDIGLAAADYLGEAGRTSVADRVHYYDQPEKIPDDRRLPRIVYVYPLLTQGLLHDSYFLGRNFRDELPRSVDPLILLDGAIVSGNCVSACDKNTTFHHQNNPILYQLFSRHGKDLVFAGVVLTSEPVRLAFKEEAARQTVELVKTIGADGVLLSKEGFGNPDADQMMLIRELEKKGIRCCALTDEFAGVDGGSQSLADVTLEADAMVSVGNANERILLPPMARIIGPIEDLSSLAGGYPQSLHGDGSLEIELQGIVGVTNELGFSRLSCREV